MKLRSFKYFFSEGLKSIKINWVMSLASIVTVTFSLLIFCLFITVTTNVNHVVDQLQSEYQLLVIVDENTTADRTEQIGNEISEIGGVDTVEFESKQQALESMKQDFDDQEIFEGLEYDNPLRDKYKVSIKNLQNRNEIETVIKSIDGVSEIKSSVETAETLVRITKYVNWISIWIYILLMIVSVTIITNTIRLAVYARRKEINIMKFIGATNWFIRWPFVIEGIIIGVIASAITIAVAWPTYNYFAQTVINIFKNSGATMFKPRPVNEVVLLLAGSSAGLGILSGVIGSLISVRKHLDV